MIRFALLLVLLFTASAGHAQASLRWTPDPRLVTLVEPAAPRVGPLAAPSHWRAGAVVGGVLGGAAGFVYGFAMDNIIGEGRMSVGEQTILGTLVGAAGGGLLGAGVGSLIRR